MNVTIEIKPSPEMVALLIDLARALRGMEPVAVAAPTKAAAAVQEPPPPITKRKHRDWVTDERAALIRSMIAEGLSHRKVSKAVNALPGLPVEAKTIKWWARKRGIVRPMSAVQAAHVATMRAKRPPSNLPRAAVSAAPPIAAPPAPKPPSLPPGPAAKAPVPRPNLEPDRLGPPLKLPTVPADTTTPIITDADTIRAKAAAWSIPSDGSIDEVLREVNAKAHRLPHRPFQLEPRRPGARA